MVGVITEVGKNVQGFTAGNRCVADPGITVRIALDRIALSMIQIFFPLQCETCFYCRRGQALLCENFEGRGVTLSGGFAEYVVLSVQFCAI